MPKNWDISARAAASRIHYESLHRGLFKFWVGNLVEIRQKLAHLRQKIYARNLHIRRYRKNIQYMEIGPELTPNNISPILKPIKIEFPNLINPQIDLSLDLEGINNEVPEIPKPERMQCTHLFVPECSGKIGYGTKRFIGVYNQRTSVARVFSRLLSISMQRPTVKGLRAIGNHCTIAHIIVLLVALTAHRTGCKNKIRFVKTFVPNFLAHYPLIT